MNFMSRTFPVLPFKETQGSALRKIKGSPVLVICETLDFLDFLDFLVAQKQKLGARGHRALLGHNP